MLCNGSKQIQTMRRLRELMKGDEKKLGLEHRQCNRHVYFKDNECAYMNSMRTVYY